jgi:hypothetical protein
MVDVKRFEMSAQLHIAITSDKVLTEIELLQRMLVFEQRLNDSTPEEIAGSTVAVRMHLGNKDINFIS